MLRKRIKGIKNSEILMVGDSVDKDLPPAKRIGLQTAIAKYGQTKDARNKMADYILENISDLLGIVRSQNPPLHKKLDTN